MDSVENRIVFSIGVSSFVLCILIAIIVVIVVKKRKTQSQVPSVSIQQKPEESRISPGVQEIQQIQAQQAQQIQSHQQQQIPEQQTQVLQEPIQIHPQVFPVVQNPYSPPSQQPLITLDQLKSILTQCGFGIPANINDKYTGMINALPKAGISTQREAAMFLANIIHESAGLTAIAEYCSLNNSCGNAYSTPLDNGKQFYGRGYIQLSWQYNYAAASRDLYGDDRLLQNPDLVQQNEQVAWDTAAWYWKTNVHNAPGVQDGMFGATTKAINGALECISGGTEQARKRYKFYTIILKTLSSSENPKEGGCYN